MAQLIKIGIPRGKWDKDRSKLWYSDIRINGHRINRALSVYKPVAQKMLNEMKLTAIAQRRGDIPNDVSWKFFKDKALRQSMTKAKNTFYADRRAFEMVEAVAAISRLRQMTPEFLDEVHIRLIERKFATAAIERSIRGMKMLMRRAEDWKFIHVQNWRTVKVNEPDGRIDFYDLDAYRDLLLKLNGVWFTSAFLMGRAGLRLGEAIHLEWPDVQFNYHRILFRSKPHLEWRIKGDKKLKKIRIVPLTNDLEAHLQSVARPSGFVLTGECSRREDVYGRQLTNALAGTKVKTYNGKYGHPHILRHTFGSHLAQAGVSLKKIAEYMGHTSQRMAEVYTHLLPPDTGDVKMLPPVSSVLPPVQHSTSHARA